jgi:serine phosphatase RsbU (regulator of sigma subunit)
LLIGTTDGVTEARSPQGEFYGMERFTAFAVRNALIPVGEILDELLNETQSFSHGKLHDDIAAFVFRIL